MAGYPLDLVKSRNQASRSRPLSVYSCLRNTVKTGGFRALFSGMSGPLLASMPMSSLIFGTYGTILEELARRRTGFAPNPTTLSLTAPLPHVFLSAAVAGSAATLLITPAELVKVRMQAQTKAEGGYASAYRCAVAAWRQGGIKELYRGLTITACKDFFGAGSWFTLNAVLVRALHSSATSEASSSFPGRRRRLQPPTRAETAIAGGVAGVMSWALVHPLDVIKSRIQVSQAIPCTVGPSGTTGATVRAVISPARFLPTAMEIWQKDGVRGFYRGLVANSCKALPSCGVTFLVYQGFIDWSERMKGRPHTAASPGF